MVKSKKITPLGIISKVFILFWVLITVVPFVYMVITSLKDQQELFSGSVFKIPKVLMVSNYIEILTGNYFNYFKNSIVVCIVGLALILTCAVMASYVFARLDFRWGGLIFNIVIACMAIPIHATLIPVFLFAKQMGLYDSPMALIGPYVAFNLPVSVFILTGFMKGIPKELEESAEIDGAGKVRIFLKIILPLSKPGLATLAIYNGINMWNEFVYALVLTSSVSKRTLPLAVWEYQGQYGVNIPMIMTILVLTALPMIILYIIFQEKLEKGMMAGAVKG
ncbi:MAG: carbohydrate ABC transporter permease [Dorea sp.]|nr:carbohydrate ABC transporter permease [Dorea sp.]